MYRCRARGRMSPVVVAAAVYMAALMASGAGALNLEEWVVLDGGSLVESTLTTPLLRRKVMLDGYVAPSGNSPCGEVARTALAAMLADGSLAVAGEPAFDGQGIAVMGATVDSGASLAEVMVRRGLGGGTTPQLRALQREAADQDRGCYGHPEALENFASGFKDDAREPETTHRNTLWNGTVRMGRSDDDVSSSSSPSLPSSWASRQLDLGGLPTGFSIEAVSSYRFVTPVDFVFLSDSDTDEILIAENGGTVRYMQNGSVRRLPFLDITAITAQRADRGIMSMAIPPDFSRGNRMLFLYFVYEHAPDVPDESSPSLKKTATVMKTPVTDFTDTPSQRVKILGTLHGFGCDEFPEDSDCLPAENKSHVGGGLSFDSRGLLFVSLGDSRPAVFTEDVLRAQQFGTYVGKVLRVTQAGRGLRRNPFATADLDARISKVWAYGLRNPFHCHVSAADDGVLFCGDTGWESREEISRVTAGSDQGWPCFEGDLERADYAPYPECADKPASQRTPPFLTWPHTADNSHSSMIGERISLPTWPKLFENSLVYGDISNRQMGFARLDRNEGLLEDLGRFDLPRAPVQARASPDHRLFFVTIGGINELVAMSYQPSDVPLGIETSFPPRDAEVPLTSLDSISMLFSRTLDTRYVARSIALLVDATGAAVPSAAVQHDFYGRTVTLTLGTPLLAGETYRVQVARTLRDLDGNRAPAGLSWRFTVTSPRPNDPPQVVATLPEDRAVDVAPGEYLYTFFDQRMDEASLRAAVTIRPASAWQVPSGPPLQILDTSYRRVDNRFGIRARLNRGAAYVVTVPAGAVSSAQGRPSEDEFQFTVYTERPPDSDLELFITSPPEELFVDVGDEVSFSGYATFRGEPVPARALAWQPYTLHCPYRSNAECHDHDDATVTGVAYGSFVAKDHQNRFGYEIELRVNYRGEQASTRRRIELNTIPATFRSDPPGATVFVSEEEFITPVTLNIAKGSRFQFVAAADGPNGGSFQRWSCGGARTQFRLPTESSFECTAEYRGGSASSPTPTPTPTTGGNEDRLGSVEVVGGFLPRAGVFTVRIGYVKDSPGRVAAQLQNDDGNSLGARTVQVPASSGGRIAFVELDISITERLPPRTEFRIRAQLLPPTGRFLDRQFITASTRGGSGGGGGGGAGLDDRIDSVELQGRDNLPRAGEITLRIGYLANEARRLAAGLRAEDGTSLGGRSIALPGATDGGVQYAEVPIRIRGTLARRTDYNIRVALSPPSGRPLDTSVLVARR